MSYNDITKHITHTYTHQFQVGPTRYVHHKARLLLAVEQDLPMHVVLMGLDASIEEHEKFIKLQATNRIMNVIYGNTLEKLHEMRKVCAKLQDPVVAADLTEKLDEIVGSLQSPNTSITK